MATGWAYISCTASTGGAATGPTGSIQFHTSGSNQTGSQSLMYYTASYPAGVSPYYQARTLVISGVLIVKGAITASSYKIIDTEKMFGSTIFGNDAEDIHLRTGSLNVVSGAVGAAWNTGTESILTASAMNRRVYVVKDQIPNRVVADRLTISGSGNGDTIDGSSYYQLTGNMPAINLYSDGSNWFVF